MTAKFTPEALLMAARQGFMNIGYKDTLLQSDYTFADVFSADQALRHVELAAFAQEPPSYRNVCFGVVVLPHDDPEYLLQYRALGAPQLFSIHPQTGKISHWQILAQEPPLHIETFESARLQDIIWEHKDTWNPEHVFRAKSIRFASQPVQLDFFDAGLLPILEDRVHEKLSGLIKDVMASCKVMYAEHHDDGIDDKALFRLIFRLVAAKLLGDRQHEEKWLSDDVQTVIADIEHFYFQHTQPEPVLQDTLVQNVAWKKIRAAFSFRNLSVESLAYVYENTLVDPAKRATYGIHATPPGIAEYIVQSLPIENIAVDERRVFEPFCGHAPFLTAAMNRLRALLPAEVEAKQRHEYLVQMLVGLEIDAFACEIALNCLLETDYPNPNGWHIKNVNAFDSPLFDHYLKQANIVLCNPPYEKDTAVKALQKILQHPPKMLGVVLPRAFSHGKSYQTLREQLDMLYNTITLVELPDVAFNFSDVETTLLIAHTQRDTRPVRKTLYVAKKEYVHFLRTGIPTTESVSTGSKTITHLAPTRLQNIWDALAHLPRFEEIAEPHRGIEYNIPFKENETRLVSSAPKSGFVKGLAKVTPDFEPYTTVTFSYLNTDPTLRYYDAYKLPWEKPKVIVNAARLSRGAWTLAATVDREGFVCYQNFHGIWPTGDIPVEVIAALLNSPVANAFLSTHSGKRHNQINTIKQIPVPQLNSAQFHLIASLVREYSALRTQWRNQPEHASHFEGLCRGIVRQLEGEILQAYNLPLELERELISYFAGVKRPGPVLLTEVQLSPSKKFYTSLIRIEDIIKEVNTTMVDAVIMSWNPHQTVRFPITLIPFHLQQKLGQDMYLLAQVNIGAKTAESLYLENITLAPELDINDGLA